MSGARDQVTRLLALVPFLHTHQDVSLREVADTFGVSPTQVVRDLKVLWMCGLPGLTPDKMIDIDFESFEDDPEGVVRIENADYLDRPVRLGSSEAAALIVALRALRESSAADSAAVIDRALAKLEAATAQGEDQSAPVEVLTGDRSHERAVAATLAEAIAADRQASLDYYVPTRDETTERTVDPIAVLEHDGRAYLDAWCHRAEARRLFRLDRIQQVAVVDRPRESTVADPRDLTTGLFEPGADDIRAEIELSADERWVADYYPVDEVEERADGTLLVRLRVGDPRWLVRLALRTGPGLRIVSPGELHEGLMADAQATLRRYEAHGVQ